ncbi:MAG: DUF3109 family protein [Chitinophagales bacterium]|nr:DUF3109 family protein [Chitinophagales bacterium]MDW8428695.1 DUF3109 family protein [Chitinophagales bacterium]
MIIIDRTIISDEVVEKPFACNVLACKGACCVEGDGGAPLTWEEATVLEKLIDLIIPYLSDPGRKAIQRYGPWRWDSNGQLATPLQNGKDACAYAVTDNGITRCAIQSAWQQGAWQNTPEATFSKPLSCHLYPVRITQYENFDAVNYHQWDLCAPACAAGHRQGIRVFEFVQEALIRRFGQPWFEQLKAAAAYMNSSKPSGCCAQDRVNGQQSAPNCAEVLSQQP